MKKGTLLLTGGLGYIGSHAAVVFEQAGYTTALFDNGSNSSPAALQGIANILGYTPIYVEGDICNIRDLTEVFQKYTFDGVIHFAGLKAVGESCEKPLAYWENNVIGSKNICEVALGFWVNKIVFSSSATVYSSQNTPPFSEESLLGTSNPYGTTKLVVEKLLQDLSGKMGSIALRYFNPIGAHPSGHIGEVPRGTPNNLLPYMLDVATGKRPEVRIFGNDWPTPDGTGQRDYLHVMDLAEAHLRAWEYLTAQNEKRFLALNLGTGKATSVLQMLRLLEEVSHARIPFSLQPRRPGDLASVWADPTLAQTTLGWSAQRSVQQAIADAWNFVTHS